MQDTIQKRENNLEKSNIEWDSFIIRNYCFNKKNAVIRSYFYIILKIPSRFII